MSRFALVGRFCAIALVVALPVWAEGQSEATASRGSSTADHSKFEILQKPFTSGPEVTQACLSCHNQAAHQVMDTVHWSWEFEDPLLELALGKRHVFNNFCGAVASNEPRCTSCHVGYGWDDMREPAPTEEARVDCLVCHDNSGQYTRLNDAAGHPPLHPVTEGARTITGAPAWPVDLNKAAQSVDLPPRQNCLSCHAYGGGGDNVKHGDISSVLIAPSHDVDVHMDADGLNFACSTCHVSDAHKIDGSRYNTHAADPHHGATLPGARRDVATCQSCHGNTPHDLSITGIRLDTHAERIACQTCHIPEYARGGVAAKTLWDWSTAGQMRDGKPFTEYDHVQSDGTARPTYSSDKGHAEWGENLVPDYAWFDGQMRYTTRSQKIDPDQIVEINSFTGSPGDPGSRIWPMRMVAGRQAYDTQLDQMLAANVWGPETESAFWTNHDWGKAIAAAMDNLGEEFSGEYDFVDTKMYWPITHMVAPAAQALGCESCHAPNARLAGITGVYMPGRSWQPATWLGLLMLGAAFVGVLGHLLLRVTSKGKGQDHG